MHTNFFTVAIKKGARLKGYCTLVKRNDAKEINSWKKYIQGVFKKYQYLSARTIGK